MSVGRVNGASHHRRDTANGLRCSPADARRPRPLRAAVAEIELDAIALAQHVDALAENGAGMKEHLFAGGIPNKAESLVCSQCLDGSCHSLTRSPMPT